VHWKPVAVTVEAPPPNTTDNALITKQFANIRLEVSSGFGYKPLTTNLEALWASTKLTQEQTKYFIQNIIWTWLTAIGITADEVHTWLGVKTDEEKASLRVKPHDKGNYVMRDTFFPLPSFLDTRLLVPTTNRLLGGTPEDAKYTLASFALLVPKGSPIPHASRLLEPTGNSEFRRTETYLDLPLKIANISGANFAPLAEVALKTITKGRYNLSPLDAYLIPFTRVVMEMVACSIEPELYEDKGTPSPTPPFAQLV